ncbi:MAG: hypothetical protein QG571_21 [Pseudomonadota bacterium]|nr:hypothetical protein [Pseudomonadota bacterium]
MGGRTHSSTKSARSGREAPPGVAQLDAFPRYQPPMPGPRWRHFALRLRRVALVAEFGQSQRVDSGVAQGERVHHLLEL